MHYKALTKTFVTDITSLSYSTEYTYNFGSGTIWRKRNSRYAVPKMHFFLKTADVIVKELGMSWGEQIEARNPIVPIDLQMGEWNWFFFFWGRQCRHISFFQCIASGKQGVQRVIWSIWKRLYSVASANGAVVDRWNHRSRSPGCLADYGTYTVNGMIPPLSDGSHTTCAMTR